MKEEKPIRKLEKLESFENGDQLYTYFTFQKDFKGFLTAVKNVIGASIVVHENGDTSVMFNGKLVEGTRSDRFNEPENLLELIQMANLN